MVEIVTYTYTLQVALIEKVRTVSHHSVPFLPFCSPKQTDILRIHQRADQYFKKIDWSSINKDSAQTTMNMAYIFLKVYFDLL